jgi:CRP-like cAMP-binding protein
MAKSPLFRALRVSLNNSEIDDLASMTQIVHFDKNTKIYSKGDKGDKLFIVNEGKVFMSLPNPHFKKKTFSNTDLFLTQKEVEDEPEQKEKDPDLEFLEMLQQRHHEVRVETPVKEESLHEKLKRESQDRI